MLNIIIIATAPQHSSVVDILEALSQQQQHFDNLVLVYEAQQDALLSTHRYPKLHVVYPTHNFVGFSAGANRDAGINYVESTFQGVAHNYVFIDGDCVPSTDFVAHHKELLEAHDVPVITCGSRRNALKQGCVVNDKRLESPLIRPRVFVPGIDRVVFDVRDIRAHNVVWSCNLGINYLAIDNIRKANKCISHSNRVFCDVFDGYWGGEDTLLGLAGFHTSTPIVCLDPTRSWITHKEHDISYQGTKNLKRVFEFEKQMCGVLDSVEQIVVNNSCLSDTPEFYGSIISATQSKYMKHVCKLLGLDAADSACMAFMFGANTNVTVVENQQSITTDKHRLAKLYSKARTTPVKAQDALAYTD